MVGPRRKYVDGKVMPIPGHNMISATLESIYSWLGWYGFNGGSQLALSGDDATGLPVVLVTNLAVLQVP